MIANRVKSNDIDKLGDMASRGHDRTMPRGMAAVDLHDDLAHDQSLSKATIQRDGSSLHSGIITQREQKMKPVPSKSLMLLISPNKKFDTFGE